MAQLIFTSYLGDKKYIFISYAHNDEKRIIPEIHRLQNLGYRIWYDEGIIPGKPFDPQLKDKVKRCDLLIVFLSKESIGSEWVWKEVEIALEFNRKIIPIYIDTGLDPAKDLSDQLSGLRPIQGVLKWKLTELEYFKKIQRAIPEYLRHEYIDDLEQKTPSIIDILREPKFRIKEGETIDEYSRNLDFFLDFPMEESVTGDYLLKIKNSVSAILQDYQTANIDAKHYLIFSRFFQISIGLSFIIVAIGIVWEVLTNSESLLVPLLFLLCIGVLLLAIGVWKKYSLHWIIAENKTERLKSLCINQIMMPENSTDLENHRTRINQSNNISSLISWNFGINAELFGSLNLADTNLSHLQYFTEYYLVKRIRPEILRVKKDHDSYQKKWLFIKSIDISLAVFLIAVLVYYILIDLQSFVPGDNTAFVGLKYLVITVLFILLYSIIRNVFRGWIGLDKEFYSLYMENKEKLHRLSRSEDTLLDLSKEIDHIVNIGQGSELIHRMEFSQNILRDIQSTEMTIMNNHRRWIASILARKILV